MGRKRKGAALAPIAARQRPRPVHLTSGWASLPTDIVGVITDRLLDGDGDVADYVAFRTVCSSWRDCTPAPRDRDPDLRDQRLRPRGWVALCDGDAVRPEDAREIALFHTRTTRRLRVRLPELRGYRIVGFSDGLLVLLHKSTTEVRVLHPFTGVAVDFPPLTPVYHEAVRDSGSFRAIKAAVCTTQSSITVVVCFPDTPVVVAVAEAGAGHWEILHRELSVWSTLLFQGRLYATLESGPLTGDEIVQLYPPTAIRPPDRPVVARVPLNCRSGDMLLAESDGRMLVIVPSATSRWQEVAFTLYSVDLNDDDDGRGKLTPVSSLGDRALFLGKDGSLSVSAKDLPSLSRNSIYFDVVDSEPALMHSLTTGSTEDLATQSQIHDGKKRIRPSVRPFTVADHLLTFCHPREWTKGLMFHEYHCIPPSFKQLRKKIMAQESLVDIGRAPDNASSSAVVSSIEEYRIFALMMREFNQRLGY